MVTYKRMQQLAGILNENNINQTVVMYASWLIKTPDTIANYAPEFLIDANNIPSSFTEETTPNGMNEKGETILCSNFFWGLITMPIVNGKNLEADKWDLLSIKFKKPLSEIYLDQDDNDLEDMGVKNLPKDFNFNRDVPLSDFLPYGLNINNRLYGCYVKSINSNEILDKEIIPQSED